jgi:hypothetical protein
MEDQLWKMALTTKKREFLVQGLISESGQLDWGLEGDPVVRAHV